MKNRLLGYYDYTVILTYTGAIFAVAGIFFSMKHAFTNAVICLMLAGVCDMFDGAVASTKDRDAGEKRFGIQIDSLSDLISFGVLPAIFTYCFVGKEGFRTSIICAAYILCALIRLAFFNVLEEERQDETDEKRKSYLGLPVTTVAVLLPAAYISHYYGFSREKAVFPILLVISAALFLIRFELKKPRVLGKIILVIVGILELVGLILLIGVDPV